jgi:hypothetical protein
MPPAIVGSDNRADVEGSLVVNCATVVSGSVPTDTIVQKHCSLHVRGNLIGSLTIEEGANVLVDGSIEGKIVNRGGRLVVHHKGLTECVVMDGSSADEADAILKINLTAIAFNWATLAKNTDADCAAVLECNAYGCGIDPIADALAKTGCRTFFVTNLAEARRVRAAAPNSVIYVLHGCTRAQRTSLQSSMRSPSSTAQSSWPSGMLSLARTGGRAAVRSTWTPARTGSGCRWRRRSSFRRGCAF